MTRHEHILTIVEPTTGGDATLDVARETVERGGTASVVMVITDRVRRDFGDFAESEEIALGEAEALALDQLRELCARRVGGSPTVATHFGDVAAGLRRYLTTETTAIAVPDRLARSRWVRRLADRSGLRVTITPSRAA